MFLPGPLFFIFWPSHFDSQACTSTVLIQFSSLRTTLLLCTSLNMPLPIEWPPPGLAFALCLMPWYRCLSVRRARGRQHLVLWCFPHPGLQKGWGWRGVCLKCSLLISGNEIHPLFCSHSPIWTLVMLSYMFCSRFICLHFCPPSQHHTEQFAGCNWYMAD